MRSVCARYARRSTSRLSRSRCPLMVSKPSRRAAARRVACAPGRRDAQLFCIRPAPARGWPGSLMRRSLPDLSLAESTLSPGDVRTVARQIRCPADPRPCRAGTSRGDAGRGLAGQSVSAMTLRHTRSCRGACDGRVPGCGYAWRICVSASGRMPLFGNARLNTMWPGGKLCRVGGIVSDKPNDMQSRRQGRPASRGDGMLHTSAEDGALFHAVTAGAGPGKGAR